MPKLSLRARLLLGVLVLAGAGLFAADAFTYTSLRSFLLHRVDTTLEADHKAAEGRSFGGDGGGGPGGPGNGCFSSDVGVYVVIRSSSGAQLCHSEPGGFTAPSDSTSVKTTTSSAPCRWQSSASAE